MRELEELQKMGLVATVNTTSLLDKLKYRYLSQNAFTFPLSMGCCALEMKQVSVYKNSTLTFEMDHSSEQESDLMIVSGHLNAKGALMIKKAYENMLGPKWVMAVGACACSGSVFEGYSAIPGLDKIIPVDVYVPGCPPSPEEIIRGLEEVQKRISLGLTERGVVS